MTWTILENRMTVRYCMVERSSDKIKQKRFTVDRRKVFLQDSKQRYKRETRIEQNFRKQSRMKKKILKFYNAKYL